MNVPPFLQYSTGIIVSTRNSIETIHPVEEHNKGGYLMYRRRSRDIQEQEFYREYDYAIQQLKKSIQERGRQLLAVLKTCQTVEEWEAHPNSHWLSVEIIHAWKELSQKRRFSLHEILGDIMNRYNHDVSVDLAVVGFFKCGDAGRLELDSDIANFVHTVDGKKLFDIDHCFLVGKNWFPHTSDGRLLSDLEGFKILSAPYLVEVNDIFVRLRNDGDRWMEEGAILEEDMLRNVWSKILLMQLTLQFEFLPSVHHKLEDNWRLKMDTLTYVLVFGQYILYYNRINGLDTTDIEKTTEEYEQSLQDTLFCFQASDAIPILGDFVRSKYLKKHQNIARPHIEQVWDTVIELFRTGNRQIERNCYGQIRASRRFREGVLGSFESMSWVLDGIRKEAQSLPEETPSRISSRYTMPGLESVVTKEHKFYDSMNRANRTKILLQLDNKQRNIYRKLEGELMRLRADMVACRTPEVQKSLINRSTNLGKLLDIELNDTDIEIFQILLLGLERDRFDATEELLSHDYKRERNTMLYGQLKTTNNWDY